MFRGVLQQVLQLVHGIVGFTAGTQHELPSKAESGYDAGSRTHVCIGLKACNLSAECMRISACAHVRTLVATCPNEASVQGLSAVSQTSSPPPPTWARDARLRAFDDFEATQVRSACLSTCGARLRYLVEAGCDFCVPCQPAICAAFLLNDIECFALRVVGKCLVPTASGCVGVLV